MRYSKASLVDRESDRAILKLMHYATGERRMRCKIRKSLLAHKRNSTGSKRTTERASEKTPDNAPSTSKERNLKTQRAGSERTSGKDIKSRMKKDVTVCHMDCTIYTIDPEYRNDAKKKRLLPL